MSLNLSVRHRFTSNVINTAPAQAGVYALWKDRELIYYGRAFGGCVTLQSRLRQHLGGDIYPCTARATHCSWEVAHDPVRRELDLMSEHLESLRDLGEVLSEVQQRLTVLQEGQRVLRQRLLHFRRTIDSALYASSRPVRSNDFRDGLTVFAIPPL